MLLYFGSKVILLTNFALIQWTSFHESDSCYFEDLSTGHAQSNDELLMGIRNTKTAMKINKRNGRSRSTDPSLECTQS